MYCASFLHRNWPHWVGFQELGRVSAFSWPERVRRRR